MNYRLHVSDVSVTAVGARGEVLHGVCGGRSDAEALRALHGDLARLEAHVNDLARPANEARNRSSRRRGRRA